MSAIIYHYTGTGNSLWIARQLAGEIKDAKLIPMKSSKITVEPWAEIIGFVFPVHMWGVPGVVLNFIQNLQKNPGTYYFAAAVNAGQVSRTLVQLNELLKVEGVKLSSGFSVELPSNYIPWGGPGTDEEMKSQNEKALVKIKEAAAVISKKEVKKPDMGPLWQRIVFTWIYKASFKWIFKMDRDFFVDEKCDSCGICAKVCPAKNIKMISGRPVWQHKCEQCLACIQWCPKDAIQFGKKTHLYPRYHHPAVKLSDMLEQIK